MKATIVCLLMACAVLTTAAGQAPGPLSAAQIEFVKIAPGEFMMGLRCG